MLKKFRHQFLLDLGEMEGEYRASHLRDDIRQSTLYILIAIISVLSMIGTDSLVDNASTNVRMWLTISRSAFAVISGLVMVAIWRTVKVKVYDQLMLVWLFLTILFLLLFNYTRPTGFLTTSYDVILPFAIYIISPLKVLYSLLLAAGFSAGTIYIDFFHKTGIDPAMLNMVIVSQVIVHVLGLGSGIQIQSYRRKSFRAFMQEKDAKEMVAYLANIDPLTKSYTRRQFFDLAETEFQRFSRYHRRLSMLVLDADHFKKINDTYGHYAGDFVLRSLALVVLEQKRAQDTFGRLGGEEFGLLLPETNIQQAKIVAQRIQKTWEQTPCRVEDQIIHSTVSVGVAEVDTADKSFEDILRRADQMMYKAKEAGRNQVMPK